MNEPIIVITKITTIISHLISKVISRVIDFEISMVLFKSYGILLKVFVLHVIAGTNFACKRISSD